MRYPKDKEHIHGYSFEPWHYRYVGVEVATAIHNEGITFEEYCAKTSGQSGFVVITSKEVLTRLISRNDVIDL